MANMQGINTYTMPCNLFSVPDIRPEKWEDEFNQHGKETVFLSPNYSPVVAHELINLAKSLLAGGRTILSTEDRPYELDESIKVAATMAKKGRAGYLSNIQVKQHHVLNGEEELVMREKRKAWQERLYQSVDSEYISGVAIHPESLLDFQLEPLLSKKGLIPGVRTDTGLSPIPRYQHEFMTEGIDGLILRLHTYRAAGARFAQWRAVVGCSSIQSGFPSRLALDIHADRLAQFASISQQAGVVPLLDISVEADGDADLVRSADIHEKILGAMFERLRTHHVLIEGILIKVTFPRPGNHAPRAEREKATIHGIAIAAATVLSRTVPSAVPGILVQPAGHDICTTRYEKGDSETAPETGIQFFTALKDVISGSPSDSPFRRLPPISLSFGSSQQVEALDEWAKGSDVGTKEAVARWSEACSGTARVGSHN